MLESASARALQQDAYRAGNEMKQSHVQASCVRQGAAVAVMSADYACVQLFKEQQRCWSIAHLHERAGVRMWDFCQGYQGEALGRLPFLPCQCTQDVSGGCIGIAARRVPDRGSAA